MLDRLLRFTVASVLLALFAPASFAANTEAEWIWSPDHKKDAVPLKAVCYFRRTFALRLPDKATLTIAADDEYVLYINGKRLASGSSVKRLDEFDLSEHLVKGNNILAVQATNKSGSTAALVARLMVKEKDSGWVSYSSGASWKCTHTPFPLWYTQLYNDRLWKMAQSFGKLGETSPWDRREEVKKEDVHLAERFTCSPEFEVLKVVEGDKAGSLIAMTFNEFGHIIASREGGPIVMVHDSKKDGVLDSIRVCCDKVKTAQGLLCLNGEIFAIADGDEGNGLYRLSDSDRDGNFETVRCLLKYTSTHNEHGPHGLVLGPNGMIYIIAGNHSTPSTAFADSSPYQNAYEGDLVTPRYEDPGGHAKDVKAPAGTIIRTDIDGSVVEVVAGGIRNSYDLAFNSEGELFFHDSDMESDLGTPWYRPTQVFHVLAGADFGWRSGWARMPEHYVDNVPPVIDTGRGSPTGACAYDHFMFPARYHGALFLGDWSEGRILAVKPKKTGASYTATSEVFLEGQPLNVTDLEVGPDGSLYFTTGGRGTSGGIYRVRWKGTVPENVSNLGTGISPVIRQPQFQSAWARQKIAVERKKIGDNWDRLIRGVATNQSNPPYYRTRALDIMQLVGPAPATELLEELAQDKSEAVRAKAAELMGLHASAGTQERLISLLGDSNRFVRRKAAESLLRAEQMAPPEKIIPLLTTDDRAEAWALRRLLERCEGEALKPLVLESEEHRVLIQGGLALMIAHPDRATAIDLCARTAEEMRGFVSDQDFIDLLRLLEVCMIRGGLTRHDLPELGKQLAEEFPAGDQLINRELIQLLVHLQEGSAIDRYLAFLDSDAPDAEKLHVGLHLRYLHEGWKEDQKLQLLEFYERAIAVRHSGGYANYITLISRDFAKTLSMEEARLAIAMGDEWPSAALGALYTLPASLDSVTIEHLKKLDQKILAKNDDLHRRLKVGIVAVLAQSADEDSFAYLREAWKNDADRRASIAMGLAQSPGGENFDLVCRSIPLLDQGAAREVINKLCECEEKCDDSEVFRQLIIRGLEFQEQGGVEVLVLLRKWSPETVDDESQSTAERLAVWQKWYAELFPDRPPAELPKATTENKHNLGELLKHLSSDEGKRGSTVNGALLFTKTNCVKCHKLGTRGDGVGPDLTNLSKRFTKKEVLESILFTKHVITDKYASKSLVLKDGRTLTGIVGSGGAGETTVTLNDGSKSTVKNDQIEETTPSRISIMPEGLLNSLTPQDISDLMAYMGMIEVETMARKPSDGGETIR
jgi:putative heme-binding domain-containing protein